MKCPFCGSLDTQVIETRLAEDGLSVGVPVTAAFEAGESLEDIRACIDLVNDQAQVAFTGKGSASAELSAVGQVTVRGAMVLIN